MVGYERNRYEEKNGIVRSMMVRRIGIDVRLFHETGVGRYIRNLLKYLALLDKKNSYVLFAKTKDVPILRQMYEKTNWEIVSTDIHWHTLSEQLSFASEIEKENLDLMHFPYFSLPIRYKKPFVVTIHDLIIHHFPTGKASTLPFPLYRLKHAGYKRVLSHAIRHAEKIIVPLETVKNDLRKSLHVPAEKIAVTKEGFDELIRESDDTENIKNIVSDKKYFLYVGNAYPHKNVKKLLEGFNLFLRNNSDFYLILVGKEDYFYREIHKFVAKHTMEHIIFMHSVSDSELAYLYKHALAFVSASQMEGFGLPPLEAMHFSCPLVLSDIPAFHEVCGDLPFFFHPNDEHGMIAGLAKAIAMNNIDKKKRHEHAKRIVDQFSWREMTEKTIEIYESSISIRPSK